MNRIFFARVVLCGTLLLVCRTRLAAVELMSEDVPVPGGTSALAGTMHVDPVPEPGRFVAELARIIHSAPGSAGSVDAIKRRVDAYFAERRRQPGTFEADQVVPIPLTAAIWSKSIFRRTLGRDDLVGAILGERQAALLCYGLAALDDETLQFLASRPDVLSRLYERAAPAFAAAGDHLRVRNGVVAVPGGEQAVPLWEAVVGEKVTRPERFISQLFETERGRIAYAFDSLAHVDPPTLAFALGSWLPTDAARAAQFQRLIAVARRAFPEWDINVAPFARPPFELAALLSRVQVDASGHPNGNLSSAFWQRVFEEAAGDQASLPQATAGPPDLGWLAEAILARPTRDRERRLDQLAFAQRVFGSAHASDLDAVAAAVRALPAYPSLLLTLERMGVTTPGVYSAAAEQAGRLTALDRTAGYIALAQFQGGLALVSRMARVRSIDAATAERLVHDLVSLRLNDDGRYDGRIAEWIDRQLDPLLPTDANVEAAILNAAAGATSGAAGDRTFRWEGQRYRVDLGSAERRRLDRTRERQHAMPIDTALRIAEIARSLSGAPTLDAARDASTMLAEIATDMSDRPREVVPPPAGVDLPSPERVITSAIDDLADVKRPGDLPHARRAGARLATLSDAMLGEALLSLAYALDLGDPEGTVLIAGDISRRHDFGFNLAPQEARIRAPWTIAFTETRGGPWHLVGSALALDMAMAPMALRRINTDRVPEAPMLNLAHRDGFAANVAAMNAADLTDADRDAIAGAVSKGRARVDALANGKSGATGGQGDALESVIRDAALDGWRSRTLRWTLQNDPARAPALFTMVDFLALGGASSSALHAWGTYAFRTTGCLCTRLAAPGEWLRWTGLAQIGMPVLLTADISLQVAVVLHNLGLPGVLAKAVLASAMQDFIDAANPTDPYDWLTLARMAQQIRPERFDDYVAAAAAELPLVSDGP